MAALVPRMSHSRMDLSCDPVITCIQDMCMRLILFRCLLVKPQVYLESAKAALCLVKCSFKRATALGPRRVFRVAKLCLPEPRTASLYGACSRFVELRTACSIELLTSVPMAHPCPSIERVHTLYTQVITEGNTHVEILGTNEPFIWVCKHAAIPTVMSSFLAMLLLKHILKLIAVDMLFTEANGICASPYRTQ